MRYSLKRFIKKKIQNLLGIKYLLEPIKQEILNSKQEILNSKQEILNSKQEILNSKQEILNLKQEILNSKQDLVRLIWKIEFDIIQEISNHNNKIAFENSAQLIQKKIYDYNIINFFFTGGSAISLLRDGYLEPKSEDIDICVMGEDIDKIFLFLKENPQFMVLNYKTEVLQIDKSSQNLQLDDFITMKQPYYDNTRERVTLIQCFDTLNLAKLDLMFIYKNENDTYFFSQDYPFSNFNEKNSRSYYINMEELKEGIEEFNFVSAKYNKDIIQLASENNLKLNMVSYKLLKNTSSFLNRYYGNYWMIERKEIQNTYHSKGIMEIVADRISQNKQHYLKTAVNPINGYFFKNADNYFSVWNNTFPKNQ